ncbi:hypothetical protein J40TS1_35960 [Paenibacillus montaniterrae]|uniref:Uncharacterized protein n=1 Tax=Paenibacillus montaniterrae TaxID=429341 RepID=A0A919YT95_9BACL|nr:hypothetical protein J40TS1_35960 [Paenibacillus montaniterrae]
MKINSVAFNFTVAIMLVIFHVISYRLSPMFLHISRGLIAVFLLYLIFFVKKTNKGGKK